MGGKRGEKNRNRTIQTVKIGKILGNVDGLAAMQMDDVQLAEGQMIVLLCSFCHPSLLAFFFRWS